MSEEDMTQDPSGRKGVNPPNASSEANPEFDPLIDLIKGFKERLGQHLPALEQETSELIQSKSTDTDKIEKMLDTLMPLVSMGVDGGMFIRLLEYYKTVDAEAAADYWQYYEEMD